MGPAMPPLRSARCPAVLSRTPGFCSPVPPTAPTWPRLHLMDNHVCNPHRPTAHCPAALLVRLSHLVAQGDEQVGLQRRHGVHVAGRAHLPKGGGGGGGGWVDSMMHMMRGQRWREEEAEACLGRARRKERGGGTPCTGIHDTGGEGTTQLCHQPPIRRGRTQELGDYHDKVLGTQRSGVLMGNTRPTALRLHPELLWLHCSMPPLSARLLRSSPPPRLLQATRSPHHVPPAVYAHVHLLLAAGPSAELVHGWVAVAGEHRVGT